MADEMNFSETDPCILNGSEEDSSDSICRDFLRYTCKRGKLCRYRHPDSSEAEAAAKKDIVFCHDFQNKGCQRPNCKFVHCTKQEEEIFRSTGQLPDTVIKNIGNNNLNGMSKMPLCKDYLKNECHRAGRCKFRHTPNYKFLIERQNSCYCDHYGDFLDCEPHAKRRAFASQCDTFLTGQRRFMISPHCQMLKEENSMLLHKIEELKKQVVDLTATNEFLLDQNAQLRVSKQTLVSPISQQLIPHTLTPTIPSLPPPSITQLSTIPLTSELGAAALPDLALGQGIAPVSIAPSQVTLPTISAASLSQSLPQTIITSTALISYPIMTQSMRPVIPHSLG